MVQYVITFVLGQGLPFYIVDLAATLADLGEQSDGGRLTIPIGPCQGRFAPLRLGVSQARINRQANDMAANTKYKTHNIYLDHKSAAPQRCSSHPQAVFTGPLQARWVSLVVIS